MNIFKDYDVRGVYPNELNENIAYKIGKAFSKYLGAEKIIVGRDMRISSDTLFNALSKGIIDSGCDVINIGLSSTPMLYFAVNEIKCDGGIMITASHNPKEWNGFKFIKGNLEPLSYNSGLKEVEEMLDDIGEINKKGNVINLYLFDRYLDYFLTNYNKFNFKVVIDAGNGMGAREGKMLSIITNVIPIYFDLDGNFPNHEANPMKEDNLKKLKEKVLEEKADFGVAFDGDADRVSFIDNKGELISGDLITALISKLYNNENIVYSVNSSWITKEEVDKNNKGIICRIGHSFIKKVMRENNCAFGGEVSGHFSFKDSFYCESSILAVLKIMELMKKENKKLSEIVEPLRKYFNTGEINFKVNNKVECLKFIEEKFNGEGKVSKLDGLKIENENWWFIIRLSNTEDLLRLIIEAKNKEIMEDIKNELVNIIEKY